MMSQFPPIVELPLLMLRLTEGIFWGLPPTNEEQAHSMKSELDIGEHVICGAD